MHNSWRADALCYWEPRHSPPAPRVQAVPAQRPLRRHPGSNWLQHSPSQDR